MQTIELPQTIEPFTDKYFLRGEHILREEGINPFVLAQVFIRKGPGVTAGLEEAVELLTHFSNLERNGGRIEALPDNTVYRSGETQMLITAPILDIFKLETTYLGIIAEETTRVNDGFNPGFEETRDNMAAVVKAANGKPVSYFGARHASWRMDEFLAKAAIAGGATSCATDVGAALLGQEGMGTMSHGLQVAFAYMYGMDSAVVETTKAFDRHIDSSVPRITLIDFNNKEIDDALASADVLDGRLYGVRVDTCGENVMQGGVDGDRKYWEGNGVTVTGVYALRQALDKNGHKGVKIILSSGFGNSEKVQAFEDAERELGVRLADAYGVGGIYHSRAATMDIVGAGADPHFLQPVSKVGRSYKPNDRLQTVVGGR